MWQLGNPVQNFEVDIEKIPDAYYHKEGEKQRRVGLWVCFLSFGNIVLDEHRFECHFELFMDWEPTKAELESILSARKSTGIDSTLLNYIPYEELQFTGSVETSFVVPFANLKLHWSDYHNKYLLFNYATVKGIFRENFELYNFPLDSQDLKLIIRLGDSDKAIWRHSGCSPANVKVEKDNLCIQDYRLDSVFCCFTKTREEHSVLGLSYAEFHAVIKLQRRWEAYSIRMFLIISIVSFSTFAIFLMEDDRLDSKIKHISTMLLTAIAFNFVLTNLLPVVPYMTYMDRYINAQFIFIFFTGVIVSLPKIFPDFEDKLNSSRLAVTSLLLWIGMHFILLVDGFRCYCKETKKLHDYKPDFPEPVVTGPKDKERNFQMEDYPGMANPVWTNFERTESHLRQFSGTSGSKPSMAEMKSILPGR